MRGSFRYIITLPSVSVGSFRVIRKTYPILKLADAHVGHLPEPKFSLAQMPSVNSACCRVGWRLRLPKGDTHDQ